MASVAVINTVAFETCVNVPSLSKEFACAADNERMRSIYYETGIGIQMVNTASEMY